MIRRFRLLFLFALCLLPLPLAAKDAAPPARPFHAVLLLDGQPDKHYSAQILLKGAELARDSFNLSYDVYYLDTPEADRDSSLRDIASSATHIIISGEHNVPLVRQLAEQYPQVKFTIIDAAVSPVYPNVHSVAFRDNEGAFLIGMLAAMKSNTAVIGFVGGDDSPSTRNFVTGYEAGARFVNEDIRVLHVLAGTVEGSPEGYRAASTAAEQQVSEGADVLFAYVGEASIAVLRTADTRGRYGIGVNLPPDAVYPGSTLTSLTKRIDRAVYDALSAAYENRWQSGLSYMGIADGSIDYTIAAYNQKMITKSMVDKVESARDLIVRGSLAIPAYVSE